MGVIDPARAGMKPIPHSVNLDLAGLFKHPLRGLQLGGDDEWVALEHGQRRAADQRYGHSGILYVCFRVHIAELNCCAACSQSEKEGSPPNII